MLSLHLCDKSALSWCQRMVEQYHYLHHPVDPRCSPLGYLVLLDEERVGCLIFGRPEATRVGGWYGSVQDVRAGKCRLTRWEIINLARVWLSPDIQRGGLHYIPNAATQVIAEGLRRVPFDYLAAHHPCFLDEPWLIKECLSYCQSDIHRGTIYKAANFHLMRENERGIQTYMRPLRDLTSPEKWRINQLATDSLRSKRYRSMRAVSAWQQGALFEGGVR